MRLIVILFLSFYSVTTLATSTAGSIEEFEAARLYQKYILDNHNENKTIEVIAGIDNIAVPGYDGVILDSQGVFIANISIKTVQNIWTVRNRLAEAIHKIKIFSKPQEWFNRLTLNPLWIDKAMKVFGVEINSIRPSVIIIDLKNEPINMRITDEQIVTDFKYRLEEARMIDEIIVFAQRKIYRVFKSQEAVKTEIRPIKLECRRLFF